MIDCKKDNDYIWTVYVHINKENGKTYVGITSKDVEERWRNGFGYYGQVFYSAIEKYGWDGFDHEIVASNLTQKEAENFEKILIKELDSLVHHNGYNVASGGLCGLHILRPVYQFNIHGDLLKEYPSIDDAENETGVLSPNIIACCCDKYSQAGGYLWKYKSDVTDILKFKDSIDWTVFDRFEPVYQFDMQQNFIAEYENALEASKQNKKWFNSSILEACRGNIRHACGYIWRFKTDIPDVSKFKNEYIDMTRKEKTGKVVLQFDLEGNFIREFKSAKEAANFYNCDPHTITYACTGRSKSGVGFLWRYKDDYNGEKIKYEPYKPNTKHVYQFDLGGNFIAEYESATIAGESIGCSGHDISATCRGKQKTCAGFIWRYEPYLN